LRFFFDFAHVKGIILARLKGLHSASVLSLCVWNFLFFVGSTVRYWNYFCHERKSTR